MPWSTTAPWFTKRAKGSLFLVEEQNHHDGMPIQFTARDEQDNKFSVVMTANDPRNDKAWTFAIFPITDDQMETIHKNGDPLTSNRVNLAALEAARDRGEKIESVTTDLAEYFNTRDLEWRETLELAIGNID